MSHLLSHTKESFGAWVSKWICQVKEKFWSLKCHRLEWLEEMEISGTVTKKKISLRKLPTLRDTTIGLLAK